MICVAHAAHGTAEAQAGLGVGLLIVWLHICTACCKTLVAFELGDGAVQVHVFACRNTGSHCMHVKVRNQEGLNSYLVIQPCSRLQQCNIISSQEHVVVVQQLLAHDSCAGQFMTKFKQAAQPSASQVAVTAHM